MINNLAETQETNVPQITQFETMFSNIFFSILIRYVIHLLRTDSKHLAPC